MITKDLLMSDDYYNLDASSKNLLTYLIVYADDDGFCDNIKALLNLSKTRYSTLCKLCDSGLVIYINDNLLVITNWFQMNKLPPSKHVKTRYKAEKAMLTLDENGIYHLKNKADSDIANAGASPAKDRPNGIEWNGMEGNILLRANGCENAPASKSRKPKQAAAYTAEFEEVWALYPKKRDKYKAYRAYQKAKKTGVFDDDIKAGINRYRDYTASEKIKKQYIKHGSTFFNQRSWEDDYDIDIKPTNCAERYHECGKCASLSLLRAGTNKERN